MKAIILAAGRGSRMGDLTIDRPKALVEFLGKPIIAYQLSVMKSLGIKKIAVVRGYKGKAFNMDGVTYYDNPEGLNMINSLFKAEQEFDDELIISYGDIIYTREVLAKLLATTEAINVVYDLEWLPQFSFRFPEPYEEAESFKISDHKIIELGGRITSSEDVQGQFIGLIKLSKEGAALFKSHYFKMKDEFSDKLFNYKNFGMIYTTEFLQSIIDEGYPVYGCAIKRQWIEFDHFSDLDKYERAFKNDSLKKIIDIRTILGLF